MNMKMPKPGPAHDNIAKMVGDWNGDETMAPSPWCPEEQQRSGKVTARMLENFFVISDYTQVHDGKVTFRGHGIYSWDPASEEYIMYWFDSMGGAGGVARGQCEGNQLTFENTSPMGQHRYQYTFEGSGYTFEMLMSPDGSTWHSMMIGKYTTA
ncbi:MAG: hypothetical protein ACI841_000453 [Planctomycetota bacterium]|jgi:hypothetical protein